MKTKIVLYILLLSINILLLGQDGSLDKSFNNDGTVITAIGAGNDYGSSVAIQKDDKIVVAGYSKNGSIYDFAVARYNSDGSLDASFAYDGKVTTAIGIGDDRGSSVTIQEDGKIVVTGSSYNGGKSDFAIVRYNIDGSLDSSFGGAGKVTTPIGNDSDFGKSIVVQSDGKIVVAGSTYNGIHYNFAIVRYNSNGSLDTSFNGDGKVTTPVRDENDYGASVAIQSDGKIVVAGQSEKGSSYNFAIVRYNNDGSLDTNFDEDGKVETGFPYYHFNSGKSLAIQSDGKIVVAGNSHGDNINYVNSIVRYNNNGSLDTSFDNDGKVTTAIGIGNNIGSSMAIQSDGKIVVAGQSSYDFAIARYNFDGSLDLSFNGEGRALTPIGNSVDIANSVAIQSDGKIVVAGSSENGNNYDFAIVRYNNPSQMVGVENSILIKEFKLSHNYPNPFNPTTMINYTIPTNSKVKIVITNILGQNVCVLVNENKSAGYYEATWNAGNLPSGIYFISITATGVNSTESFTQIKKALLLK